MMVSHVITREMYDACAPALDQVAPIWRRWTPGKFDFFHCLVPVARLMGLYLASFIFYYLTRGFRHCWSWQNVGRMSCRNVNSDSTCSYPSSLWSRRTVATLSGGSTFWLPLDSNSHFFQFSCSNSFSKIDKLKARERSTPFHDISRFFVSVACIAESRKWWKANESDVWNGGEACLPPRTHHTPFFHRHYLSSFTGYFYFAVNGIAVPVDRMCIRFPTLLGI